jgi:phosphohistidine swiveling domain-containing protein
MSTRWFKWERESSILTICLCCEAGYLGLKTKYGKSYPPTYLVFEGNIVSWLNDFDNLEQIGAEYVKKLLNKNFYKRVIEDWKKVCKALESYCKKINSMSLNDCTEEELLKIYRKFYLLQFNWWSIGLLAELVSYGSEFLLRKFLKNKLKLNQLDKLQNYLNILTAPTKKSFSNKEEEDLMRIFEARKRNEDIRKLLRQHVKKYYWLQNNYLETKYLDEEHFIRAIEEFSRNKSAIQEKIISVNKKISLAKKNKNALARELRLGKNEREIISLIGSFMAFHDARKRLNLIELYALDILLEAISKRIKIPLAELKYLIPGEVENAIKGKVNIEEINRRKGIYVIKYSLKKFDILTGEKAEKLAYSKFRGKQDLEGIKEIIGMPASPGIVSGKARIIKSPKLINLVEKGDILVTTMTSPDFLPAMKKAAAIITDEGGITSHAAIVSRELGIPCIIGTKIATKVLKDGQLVEVNANHGWVKIIK